MTEAEIYQKQVETCKQVQDMINALYISKDKIKEIFYNKRNEIIFIRDRNERLYKVKILDEIEKELLEED